MAEYRTMILDEARLLEELQAACDALLDAGCEDVAISFGWGSNMSIEQMWQKQCVPIGEVMAFVAEAERSDIARVGTSDIFVESPGFLLTLCHEGDVHVEGGSALVEPLARRWDVRGYAPYEVRRPA
jgi:hypothetical protein